MEMEIKHRCFVTHEGESPIARCHAMATSEEHQASLANNLPEQKLCDKQVSSWRHTSCHTDKNRYYT